MADIAMCQNNLCPSKENCYRFTAKANEWRQAYMNFQFDERGKCNDFVEAQSLSQVRRLDAMTKEEE